MGQIKEDIPSTTVTANIPTTKFQIINNLINNMVLVDSGEFSIRIPPSKAYVTDSEEIITRKLAVSSFQIGRYQVTQEEWEVVMDSNPSKHQGAKHPVEYVGWGDCQEFILKLNAMTRMRFRLPTEAEWEFAARGGKKSLGFLYSGGNNLDDVAWFRDNTLKKGVSDPDYGTHPVGQKEPNELGLYDMSGNVWEWCEDCYDGQGTSLKNNALRTFYAFRGGGWKCTAGFCRVSRRIISHPAKKGEALGFRLAI